MLTAKERIEDYEWCIVQYELGAKRLVCGLLYECFRRRGFTEREYDFRHYHEFRSQRPNDNVFAWWAQTPFDFTSRITALRRAIELAKKEEPITINQEKK